MNTRAPKSTELEEVSFLVHPGFGMDFAIDRGTKLFERYKVLMGEYSRFAETMDTTKHALVVLCHDSEEYIRKTKRRAPSEYCVADILDSLCTASQEKLVTLFSVIGRDVRSCRNYLDDTKVILAENGQHIGKNTDIQVFGESAGVCVSQIATSLASLLPQTPNIPLALTNARLATPSRLYKEGGENLKFLVNKFPSVDFIPLPKRLKRKF